jgi:hypothetical protein
MWLQNKFEGWPKTVSNSRMCYERPSSVGGQKFVRSYTFHVLRNEAAAPQLIELALEVFHTTVGDE